VIYTLSYEERKNDPLLSKQEEGKISTSDTSCLKKRAFPPSTGEGERKGEWFFLLHTEKKPREQPQKRKKRGKQQPLIIRKRESEGFLFRCGGGVEVGGFVGGRTPNERRGKPVCRRRRGEGIGKVGYRGQNRASPMLKERGGGV